MSHNDMDRVEMWLEETAPHEAPDGLIKAVERELAQHRPKRVLGALLTERSMRSSGRVVVGSPSLRTTYLIALILLGVTLGAGAIALGSRFLPSPPAPYPLSGANGLIAYDTNAVIYVARPDGTAPRPLVDDLPGAASATWSPDGTKLAFWAEGSPDALYVVDADGSNRIRVAGDLWIATNMRPAWSPDGRQIVFSTESGPDRNDERIFVVNADGSNMTELGPDHPEDPLRRLMPAWSPDGAWISFQGIPDSLPADESQLYVIRPDGTGERKISTPGRYFWLPGPWEPTTTNPRLVFAGGDVRSGGDIYIYDVIADNATLLSGDAAFETIPTWSPDGRRVAWFATDYQGKDGIIKIADADGSGGVQTLATNGISGPPGWLAWSPDGTKVYGSNADKTSVIVLTIDGSQPPVVIAHPAGQGMPSWQRLTPLP
jgi:hypothetical protein